MRVRVKRRWPELYHGCGRPLGNDPVSRWNGAGLRLPQDVPVSFGSATMYPMAGHHIPRVSRLT